MFSKVLLPFLLVPFKPDGHNLFYQGGMLVVKSTLERPVLDCSFFLWYYGFVPYADPEAQRAYLREYATRDYVKAANAERYQRSGKEQRHKRFEQLPSRKKAEVVAERKVYAQNNREVIAARVRNWRSENLEEVQKMDRERYDANKVERRAKNRRVHAAKKDKVNKNRRIQYHSNIEEKRAVARQAYKENKPVRLVEISMRKEIGRFEIGQMIERILEETT